MEVLEELVDNNIDTVLDEFKRSADGKFSASISLNWEFNGLKVSTDGKMAFTRKYKNSASKSFEVEDPNQSQLFAVNQTEQEPHIKAGL